MRLHEITAFNRSVVATDRFRKDFKEYEKAYASVEDFKRKLHEFLEYKVTAPSDRSAKRKDAKFKYQLTTTWHWHIIFGAVVVIYDMTNEFVRLMAVVDHKATEGKIAPGLVAYVLSLTDDDFTPYSVYGDEPRLVLDIDTKNQINQYLYDMAANESDRELLVLARDGEWDDTLKQIMVDMFAAPDTDSDKWEAIVAGFGGQAQFLKLIDDILRFTS